MTRKIKISESDFYNIIKRVLLEQEKEKKKEVTFTASLFEKFILSPKSNQFINKLNSEYKKVVVSGNLDLDDTSITSLPDNLYVEGVLWLRFCKNLTSLPDNLEVFGHLDLRGTNIKSLPMTLTVKHGLIWIDDTPLNYNEELLQKYDNFPIYRY
jgi:hypothetical protein